MTRLTGGTKSLIKIVIRELKQDDDISKEDLQAFCLRLAKELLSKERAIETLTNRIKNLENILRKHGKGHI